MTLIRKSLTPSGPTAGARAVALGVVSLLLAGCAGFPQIGTGATPPSPPQVQAAVQWTDHYAYFPGYEIYYNRTKGYYVYRTEAGWVSLYNLPPEVDEQEMLASPFVTMTFPDSPVPHHARIVRDYPFDWGLAKR